MCDVQPPRARPPPRLPRPFGHPRRPQRAACAPRSRPQVALGLISPDVEPSGRTLRPETLRKRADFLSANRGLRVARPGFVLLVNPRVPSGDPGLSATAPDPMRFGVTVTKKIGNAVVRNRMKRRFRALLRELLPLHGIAGADHVMIGREGGVERDFAALRRELAEALARAAAGKGDPPRRPQSGNTNNRKRQPGPRKR